jgi:hypothetical protein
VARYGADIESTLTQADVGKEYQLLLDAIDRYEAAAEEWHAGERRYVTRFLQGLVRAVEKPFGWLR